jgi:lactoylglutathione lyase
MAEKVLSYIFIFVDVTNLIIMHIDHIAIWTRDIDSVKDFYVRYFNCTVGERYVNPVKKFSSFFLSFQNGARIELMRKDDIDGERIGEKLGLAHVALEAGSREEVDRITEQLEREGIRIKGRPRITGDGYYESVILDPEGNIVEIVSK